MAVHTEASNKALFNDYEGGGRDLRKEAEFLRHYRINGHNAKKAAMAAGYAESTANTAYKWIRFTREKSTKPELWDAFHAGKDKVLSHLDVTYERILTEYARLAFLDPAELFNADGSPKSITDMSEDTRRAISGLEVSDSKAFGRVLKMKLADKKGALDSLSKVIGMMDTNVKVQFSFEELLKEVTLVAQDEPLVIEQDY